MALVPFEPRMRRSATGGQPGDRRPGEDGAELFGDTARNRPATVPRLLLQQRFVS